MNVQTRIRPRKIESNIFECLIRRCVLPTVGDCRSPQRLRLSSTPRGLSVPSSIRSSPVAFTKTLPSTLLCIKAVTTSSCTISQSWLAAIARRIRCLGTQHTGAHVSPQPIPTPWLCPCTTNLALDPPSVFTSQTHSVPIAEQVTGTEWSGTRPATSWSSRLRGSFFMAVIHCSP